MFNESALVFQDEQGLVFYAPELVVSLTQEGPGRVRAVTSDGAVAFCPTLPEGPWTARGDSWVLPHLHEAVDDQGFLIKTVTAAKLSAKRVLRQLRGGLGVWDTDQGEQATGRKAAELAAENPEFLLIYKGLWMNLTRLRRLEVNERRKMLLFGDDGKVWVEISSRTSPALLKRLALEHSHRIEPAVPGLSRWFLRDWPTELAVAPGEELRRYFFNADQLMANLVYQVFRYRRRGLVKHYGESPAGLFYDPADAALYRAGFLNAGSDEENRTNLRQRFFTILEEMVEMKLLTFHDLGFRDKYTHLRRIGERRPGVVLVIEKESLQAQADFLSDEFGVSYLITGGAPRLISTENFVRALRQIYSGPVQLRGYVDYDARGWQTLDSVRAQFEHYGLEIGGESSHLVWLQDFTPEEISLFAIPCPMGSKEVAAMVMKWVRLTGGIGGKAMGIHANHLPLERVRKRLQASL